MAPAERVARRSRPMRIAGRNFLYPNYKKKKRREVKSEINRCVKRPEEAQIVCDIVAKKIINQRENPKGDGAVTGNFKSLFFYQCTFPVERIPDLYNSSSPSRAARMVGPAMAPTLPNAASPPNTEMSTRNECRCARPPMR